MEENKVPVDLLAVEKFAKEKHKGQVRADGITPYITHPRRVAKLMKKFKNTSKNLDELMAVALLHDVLEDCYCSFRELKEKFGVMIASMVMEVTTASYVPILVGKDAYLISKMLNMTSYALDIKLADRLDNVSDLEFCSSEKRSRTYQQTRRIINAIKQKENLTATQQILIKEIEKVLVENDY